MYLIVDLWDESVKIVYIGVFWFREDLYSFVQDWVYFYQLTLLRNEQRFVYKNLESWKENESYRVVWKFYRWRNTIKYDS